MVLSTIKKFAIENICLLSVRIRLFCKLLDFVGAGDGGMVAVDENEFVVRTRVFGCQTLLFGCRGAHSYAVRSG